MYVMHLTDAQRQELQRRTHAADAKPRTRDRLEMVRLGDAGWSCPRIARHLGLCEETVRTWLKAFLTGGFDALADQPHPGQQSALTPAMEEAIREQLRHGMRTWTAAHLADWLDRQFGVRLSPAHLGRRLKRARIVYKRNSRSVKHKQDPVEVAAKQEEMASLEKRGTTVRSTSPISTKPASL